MPRDTARLAEMSWPDANPRFRWPPSKRSRPALGPTSNRAETFETPHTPEYNPDGHGTQTKDVAAEIDRTADFLLQLGYGAQAERLAHKAQALREEGRS